MRVWKLAVDTVSSRGRCQTVCYIVRMTNIVHLSFYTHSAACEREKWRRTYRKKIHNFVAAKDAEMLFGVLRDYGVGNTCGKLRLGLLKSGKNFTGHFLPLSWKLLVKLAQTWYMNTA